jgi:Rrf2 family protein
MNAFLSQTAEYALRAMAWLASTSPEAPVRARDLSEGTQIPAQYLAKILRRLVVSGVLESRKGHGGGFSLARPADQISFRDVLLAVDAYPAEERCAFGWGECDALTPLPAARALDPHERAVHRVGLDHDPGRRGRATFGAARRRAEDAGARSDTESPVRGRVDHDTKPVSFRLRRPGAMGQQAPHLEAQPGPRGWQKSRIVSPRGSHPGIGSLRNMPCTRSATANGRSEPWRREHISN